MGEETCEDCRGWEEELYWTHFQCTHFFQILSAGFDHQLVSVLCYDPILFLWVQASGVLSDFVLCFCFRLSGVVLYFALLKELYGLSGFVSQYSHENELESLEMSNIVCSCHNVLNSTRFYS